MSATTAIQGAIGTPVGVSVRAGDPFVECDGECDETFTAGDTVTVVMSEGRCGWFWVTGVYCPAALPDARDYDAVVIKADLHTGDDELVLTNPRRE